MAAKLGIQIHYLIHF